MNSNYNLKSNLIMAAGGRGREGPTSDGGTVTPQRGDGGREGMGAESAAGAFRSGGRRPK